MALSVDTHCCCLRVWVQAALLLCCSCLENLPRTWTSPCLENVRGYHPVWRTFHGHHPVWRTIHGYHPVWNIFRGYHPVWKMFGGYHPVWRAFHGHHPVWRTFHGHQTVRGYNPVWRTLSPRLENLPRISPAEDCCVPENFYPIHPIAPGNCIYMEGLILYTLFYLKGTAIYYRLCDTLEIRTRMRSPCTP